MVNLTLDEITLNAVKAGLDERIERLNQVIANQEWRRDQRERLGWPEHPQLLEQARRNDEDAQRALVWNIAALHQTKLAREIVGDAEVVPEQADAMTAAKAYEDLGYHDAQIEYGNREGDPAFNGAFDKW